MQLYANVTSERASKGQGGNEYIDIILKGAHETEIMRLNLVANGAGYTLRGWTHDNHYIEIKIEENMTRKGNKQKGECEHENTEWRDEKGKSYLNCFDCCTVLRRKDAI